MMKPARIRPSAVRLPLPKGECVIQFHWTVTAKRGAAEKSEKKLSFHQLNDGARDTLSDMQPYQRRVSDIRRQAVAVYYRAVKSGLLRCEAERKAAALWRKKTGKTITARTVRNWLAAVKKAGGSEAANSDAFMPQKKGARPVWVPFETREYLADLILSEGCQFNPAIRRLRSQLKAWQVTENSAHAVPGYERPPANKKNQAHPPGWSYFHLRNAPGIHELVVLRALEAAAGSLRASVKEG